MFRSVLATTILFSAFAAQAVQLTPQEGVSGVAWLSSREAFKTKLSSKSVDMCAEIDALSGSSGDPYYRTITRKLGRSCVQEVFLAHLGTQALTLSATFDTSDRLVRATTNTTKYSSTQDAATACREMHGALAASFGTSKTSTTSDPNTGSVLATSTWSTLATAVELACYSNALKGLGSISIELTFAPHQAFAKQVR